MATGNVGPFLSEDADEISTFFSRDGGLTWEQIADGSHIFEFGDHGSAMVAAPDRGSSNFILFVDFVSFFLFLLSFCVHMGTCVHFKFGCICIFSLC